MKTKYKFLLVAAVVSQLPLYAQKNSIVHAGQQCCFTEDSNTNALTSALSREEKTVEDTSYAGPVATEPDARTKAAIKRLKVFNVYPAPANNIVYLRITGKQTIMLHNANDSLIFKVAIREKATIDIRKLPVGRYYFTEAKTGIKKEMIIARNY